MSNLTAEKIVTLFVLLVTLSAITACANEPSPTPDLVVSSPTVAPVITSAPASTGGAVAPTPTSGSVLFERVEFTTSTGRTKVEYEGIEVPDDFGVFEIRITSRASETASATMVTVSNIEVQEAEAGEEEGWISLFEDTSSGSGSLDPMTLDLIETSRADKVLGFEILPIGKYVQIRMNVDNVEVTSQPAGGGTTTQTIEMSDEKLKLVRKISIADQTKTILTVDFDADRSVAPNDGGDLLFEPVFRLKGRSHHLNMNRWAQ